MITRIEMDYMNSMIALSRAYRENSKLIYLKGGYKDDNRVIEVYVPKNQISKIEKTEWEGKTYYIVDTQFMSVMIDEEQGKKLIETW